MGKDKPTRVTLADVAARAGLSKSAASMILNDRPGSRLSAEAVERVRTAAVELGYRPNPAAQSLRRGRTQTIGFISDRVTVTRYTSGMIEGVLSAARQSGHTVLMAETHGEAEQLREAVDTMRDRRVDGLVFGFMDARVLPKPLDLPESVPSVLVNGIDGGSAPTVLPDEYAAGRSVIEYLLGRSQRRIAILGRLRKALDAPEVYRTISRRFAGMDDALSEAGITPIHVGIADDWNPENGFAMAEEFLASGIEDAQAIVCANDRVAMGVYQSLQRHGLEPGRQISVISFDDEVIAGYLRPNLTTAKLPYEDMGRRAVELLLAGQPAAGEVLVPMPLVERDSV